MISVKCETPVGKDARKIAEKIKGAVSETDANEIFMIAKSTPGYNQNELNLLKSVCAIKIEELKRAPTGNEEDQSCSCSVM